MKKPDLKRRQQNRSALIPDKTASTPTKKQLTSAGDRLSSRVTLPKLDSSALNQTSDSVFNKQKSKCSRSNLSLFMIGCVILLVCVLLYIAFSTGLDRSVSRIAQPALGTNQPATYTGQTTALVEPAAAPSNTVASTGSASTMLLPLATDESANLQNIPDSKDILSAPIPGNNALIKEELQKLEDETMRLQEQEKLLAEQVALMDEWNAKKQERIALLQQQTAQLESP